MSNNISALRTTLFDTLQAVKSGEMDIDRARAVSDIAQTIINTAKTEIDYAKATGAAVHSSLIETSPDLPRKQKRDHYRDTLHDCYVRRIMAQHLGIKGREIPQVLVDAHRELMKLKRELMNEKL